MDHLRFVDPLVAWFIPATAAPGRTESGLARTFVFTHLFGPLIAQPMWLYLYAVMPKVEYPLVVMAVSICSFWTLPFFLRWSGSIKYPAFASFQMLTAASLFGAFHFGGFSSPFLPWLVVSLLLGLFYLNKHPWTVLGLFSLDIGIFVGVAFYFGIPDRVPVADLRVLGWLSLASATIYMTWMALYYSRIIGLRSELESEIERQRITSLELEKARIVAEETAQARARFFTKMSHELRTPLNAIIGYSDILLEDRDPDAPEHAQIAGDISRINAAGRHLLSLVADVLDGDREEESLHVETHGFRLGSLCDEVVATATPMVERNGNAFNVTCSHPDYVLFTDATKLRQVLLNLLSNAGKFTRDGVVKLDLSIEFRPHDDHLNAAVSDSGIGISPESLSRLFQTYEQADATVFNRFGGTGIGLALSRTLSILLGGDISVTSRAGHGSRFVVTIPAQLQTEGSDTGATDENETETIAA